MKTLDTKYSPSLFSLYDYERVEEHLHKMAAKGWQIDKTGSFVWRFKKSIPTNKKYAVVFSKDTSDYDPYPSEGQKMLKYMSEEAGWNKETEWKQMQIFSSTDMNQELETDEQVKLYSIRKSMRKTFIPCWVICLVAMLFFAIQNVLKLQGGNLAAEYETVWAIIITSYAAFVSASILAGYSVWRVLSAKAIEEGRTCISTKWSTVFQYALCAGLLILVVCYLFGTINAPILASIIYAIMYLIIIVATVFITSIFTDYLRKCKVKKALNILSSGLVFVGVFIIGIALTNYIGTIL